MPMIKISSPDVSHVAVEGDLTAVFDRIWKYDPISGHSINIIAVSDGTLLKFSWDAHGVCHIACLHKGLADIEILEATHCVIMRTNLAAQFAWVSIVHDYKYWEG